MKELSNQEKLELTALLIQYNIHDIWRAEAHATDKRDFEALKKLNEVDDAITTILDYMSEVE